MKTPTQTAQPPKFYYYMELGMIILKNLTHLKLHRSLGFIGSKTSTKLRHEIIFFRFLQICESLLNNYKNFQANQVFYLLEDLKFVQRSLLEVTKFRQIISRAPEIITMVSRS